MSSESEHSGVSSSTGLTQCSSCGKNIGVMADNCVGCGAPNRWVHPDVKTLVEDLNSSKVLPAWSVKWVYGHDRERVWGNSSATLTRAGWIVRFVQWLGWFGVVWMHMTLPVRLWTMQGAISTGTPFEGFRTTFQIVSFLTYGIAIWIVKGIVGKRVMLSVPESTFEARFHPHKQWNSTNESLWAPLRARAGFGNDSKKYGQADPIDRLALFFNLLPQAAWNGIIAGVFVVFFFLPTEFRLPEAPQLRDSKSSSALPRPSQLPAASSPARPSNVEVARDVPKPVSSEEETVGGEWGDESGYTVVVASEGTRDAAEVIRSKVERAGFEAGILRSDDYTSLRPGYWVVFVGKFSVKADADAEMRRLRGNGFSIAYSRLISR